MSTTNKNIPFGKKKTLKLRRKKSETKDEINSLKLSRDELTAEVKKLRTSVAKLKREATKLDPAAVATTTENDETLMGRQGVEDAAKLLVEVLPFHQQPS
jgi:chromosome segregation ATPase